MSNVSEWAVTAGGNISAPPDGAPENMLPGKVNDCMREIQAAVSRWYQDSNATLVSTGGSVSYVLTTNSGHTALSDIPLLVFRVNVTNTSSGTTLNVDGLGAKPWRRSADGDWYRSGELVSGQVVVVAYNSGDDDFYTVGPVYRNIIESGTLMLFQQTAAPTGWTKQVTHDNKALRVVTGTASSGGSTAFTSVLTSRVILHTNLPSANLSLSAVAYDHTHTFFGTGATDSQGLHSHSYTDEATNEVPDRAGGGGATCAGTTSTGKTTSTDGAHAHNVSVSGTSAGSNYGNLPIAGHAVLGGFSTPMDFAVQYVDLIIASKD